MGPGGPQDPNMPPRVSYHYYSQNSNQNVMYPDQRGQPGPYGPGYVDPSADRKPGFNPIYKRVHRRAKLRRYLMKKRMSQKKNPKNASQYQEGEEN
jgi:hypothetical protein